MSKNDAASPARNEVQQAVASFKKYSQREATRIPYLNQAQQDIESNETPFEKHSQTLKNLQKSDTQPQRQESDYTKG